MAMRKPGAWAEEAERADAEAAAAAPHATSGGASPPLAAAGAPSDAFPSLNEAAAAGSRKGKKKGVTMTIQQLNTGKLIGPNMRPRGPSVPTITSDSKLTPDEMMMLPTGPRERTEEELQQFGGLGGGFRSYGGGGGGYRGGGYGNRGENEGGRYEDRGYDRRDHGREEIHSRADEVENWARAKMTPAPPLGGGGYDDDRRREQRLSDRDMPSRADEVDDWSAGKKFVPSSDRGGYQDRRRGYDRPAYDRPAYDDWGSNRRYAPPAAFNEEDPAARLGERPRLVLQPRTVTTEVTEVSVTEVTISASSKPVKASPFGAARPREEVLAEKGQDWKKLEEDLEKKVSIGGGSSATSSRQGTPDTSKPRPKVDPFGNARPREELLQERGQDYLKMDFELEHKAINRAETEAERELKAEIKLMAEQLQQESEMNGFASQHEDGASLKEMLARKEADLVRLTRELDDKVRFAQKSGRPTSQSGSEYGDGERPPSRRGPRERPPSAYSEAGGMYEPASAGPWAERPVSRSGSRDVYQERPPSRDSRGGTRADVWTADPRPPSRSGSRDYGYRRNGRPPSRDFGGEYSPNAGGGGGGGPAVDVWKRPPERSSRW